MTSQLAPAANSSQITINDLPNELKAEILRQMPDIASLKAIVHASSQYHQIYFSMREIILTEVTIRTLAEEESIRLDLRIPYQYKATTFGSQEPDKTIAFAAQTVANQAQSKMPIRLSIEQCVALRLLSHANRWYVTETKNTVWTAIANLDLLHCFSEASITTADWCAMIRGV